MAVPSLHTVAREISHLGGGWLILAGGLELASCANFVVVFRGGVGQVGSCPAEPLTQGRHDQEGAVAGERGVAVVRGGSAQ